MQQGQYFKKMHSSRSDNVLTSLFLTFHRSSNYHYYNSIKLEHLTSLNKFVQLYGNSYFTEYKKILLNFSLLEVSQNNTIFPLKRRLYSIDKLRPRHPNLLISRSKNIGIRTKTHYTGN